MALVNGLEKAWRVRTENFPAAIGFDYPESTAVVSLTGHSCALDCAHCGGLYLKGMTPIWEFDGTEVPSCLISGGCDRSGRVPILPHLDRIRQIKKDGNGPRLNWHVGLISEEEMEQIAPYVDTVSFDFVGDNESIREVYGLDKTVDDYVETYCMLKRHARVMPHVTIGLRGGEISGEYEALRLMHDMGVEGLSFIVFRPTKGTRYGNRQATPVELVVDVLVHARLLFPDRPLFLGCMRPHGAYRAELDCLAVRAGINKIVQPAAEAIRLAGELGLQIVRGEECCAL